MSIPTITLGNGVQIPQFGLGTWKVTDQAEYDGMFTAAVEAGYRHFDTAQIYDNEQMLGAAWQAAGVKISLLLPKFGLSISGLRRRNRAFKIHLTS
jgi:diketogulonate reductase-like aldo/keto reductase